MEIEGVSNVSQLAPHKTPQLQFLMSVDTIFFCMEEFNEQFSTFAS